MKSERKVKLRVPFFRLFLFSLFLGCWFCCVAAAAAHAFIDDLPALPSSFLLLLLRRERSSSSSSSSSLLLLRAPCLSAIKHLPESCFKWSVRALLACFLVQPLPS